MIKLKKGKVYLLISAFIYGLAPVLARFAYSGGVNSITLTFLRSVICLPLLLILLIIKKIPLSLTKKEIKDILSAGIIGNAFMMITLYASYEFIPVGLSTVLHYIYPLIIVIVCALIFRDKPGKKNILSSVLVTTGIFLFAEIESGSDKIGIILASLSGLLYAFNIIYLDKSGLDRMNYIKLTFYFSLIMSITAFLFAFFSDSLTFDISGYSWLFSILISVLVTMIALPFFQLGIMHEGAAKAGILSTAEPITSVVLGVIFLNEGITLSGIIGCVMIILGIVIIQTQ